MKPESFALEVAARYRDQIRGELSSLGKKIRLVGFLSTDQSASLTYSQYTAAGCSDVGIEFELIRSEPENLANLIRSANNDDNVNGILVYYPIFGTDKDEDFRQLVSPEKDVEGLNQFWFNKLYNNERFCDEHGGKKAILPCMKGCWCIKERPALNAPRSCGVTAREFFSKHPHVIFRMESRSPWVVRGRCGGTATLSKGSPTMREEGPMRSGLVRSVAVLAMVLALPASSQDGGNIALGVGTQKVLTVPGIQRVAIGDPNVADVKTIGNNQLLIIGSTEGKTTLLVWKTSGQRVSYLVSMRTLTPSISPRSFLISEMISLGSCLRTDTR